jgi:microcystin-dependent protein
MGEPFIGEIRIVSFGFAPRSWANCDGQLLPINQNQALFSLFGTMYGGNGQTTFALPNLRGRVPMHAGNGFTEGTSSGAPSHTLTSSEMPAHSHSVNAVGTGAGLAASAGNTWGTSGLNPYLAAANNTMAPAAIAAAGGGQPHENRQPYLVLRFVVALTGIFPSRT